MADRAPGRHRARSRTRLHRTAPLLLAVAMIAIAPGALPASAGAADGDTPHAYRAEIRWTPYGIPHVIADDYAGLGFGLGIATAEATICELFDRIVTSKARRSFHLGRGTNNANVRSDLYYAGHRARVAEWLDDPSSVESPSPQARDLVRGYTAGVNRYLRDIGGTDNIPDARCQGAPWIEEIEELDYWTFIATYRAVPNLGGQVAASPPGGTNQCPNDPSAPAPHEHEMPDVDGNGSNAIAVGREATKNGRGVFLGNPHYPWTGANRFYRHHSIIPGELNVVGAGLANMPVVGIGHNHKVAWSHTVSTATRVGYFQLTLDPDDPTRYMYDGESRPMKVTCVSVPVREANGSITTANRALYDTHFGPMVHTTLMPWTPDTGFAIRSAVAGLRFVDQYLAMGRAQSVRDLAAQLNRYGGTSFNTTAVDTHGEVFYGDLGAIPNVSEAKAAACILPGLSTEQWAEGVPVLDGSRSECEWGNDPGAPPGLSGLASAPHLFRSDYVTQSNDSHWLGNPAQPLEGFSRVFGDERTARSLRTRMGLKMVAERIAGTDGLPGTGFDLDTIQDVMYSNRQLGAELARDAVVDKCRAQPTVVIGGETVDLTEACAVLAAWDLRENLDSRGAHLWRQFAITGALLWSTPFDVNDPVNTPRDADTAPARVMNALANSVLTMESNDIPLDARLGDVQAVTRQGQRIPLHGGRGVTGQFNVLAAEDFAPGQGWTTAATGASWIMTVEFTDDGPRSEGVLTYSQSTNPASPHSYDQTLLYSNYGWEDLYYELDAVEAATVRKASVFEGPTIEAALDHSFDQVAGLDPLHRRLRSQLHAGLVAIEIELSADPRRPGAARPCVAIDRWEAGIDSLDGRPSPAPVLTGDMASDLRDTASFLRTVLDC